MTENRTDEVSSFLMNLEDSVRLIETHVSKVFLTRDRAYKLKKPVFYPYLDYSTVEKRRQACEQEVALNSRTAPTIYLGAIPITQSVSGSLSLAGEGEVIDWLVEMQRFDDSLLLSEIVKTQALEKGTLEVLAAQIASFHKNAPQRREKGGYGGLTYIINNNADCYDRFGREIFDQSKVRHLNELSRSEVQRVRRVLEKRREEGFVRQCHGDMHLRNIFLLDGMPTLFDAIEFNADISCIDVLYDLAFLLMDLDERGLQKEASLVFNRYMDITGDLSGLPALPLMLSMRASIRALVGAAALVAKGKDQNGLSEARLYLDNALKFLKPHKPQLIAIGGLSGSGKSTIAQSLAPRLQTAPGALILRSDAIRKRLSNVKLDERLGAEAYTPEKSAETYQEIYDHAKAALEAGRSVIADAVFAKEEERRALEQVAKESRVSFTGLWIDVPRSIMAERIRQRQERVSDATVEVLEQQLTYDLGDLAWVKLDGAGSVEEITERALACLSDQSH